MFKLYLRASLVILPALLLAGCSNPPITFSGGGSNPTGTTSGSPVSLTTTSLPYAVTGAAYGANVLAANGSQPYTFSISTGALPTGVSLSSTGHLSGTPTTSGSFPFAAQVTDAAGSKAAVPLTLTVVGPLVIATSTLANGQVGAAYSTTLQVTGGIAPYTVSLASGALPAGLALSAAGAITGTPTAYGSFTIALAVKDTEPAPQAATASFTFVIKPAPLAFTYPAASATLGKSVSLKPTTTGGTTPVTFALATGTLPAGLTLSTTDGSITGTPTAAGASTISVTATDSTIPTAQTVTSSATLTVFNAIVAVDTTKSLATVPATAFGIHTSVYDSSLSDTTALPALLSTTGIKMLRYPGGSYSDLYHWAQYTMTPYFASANPACNVTPNGYLAPNTDFGHFLKTLAATGTQAIITVNYGSSLGDANGSKSTGTQGTASTSAANTCSEPNTGGQPQEAAAWVAYANGDPASSQTIGIDAVGFDWKTVGFWAGLRAATPLAADDGFNFLRIGVTTPIGIKYWEIGNEVYYNGFNSNNNAESDIHAPYVYASGYGSTYASRADVSALSPTSYGTNAAAYIQAMRAVDPTVQIGIVVSSAIDPIPATWTPAVLKAVCASATFDFAIVHYYPGTYNATTAAELLTGPQADMPHIVSGVKSAVTAACPASAAVPVFITETNPDGTLVTGTPDAVPGLYATHEFLTALESGVANIEWLELHSGAGTFLTAGTEAPGPAFYGIELAHQLAGIGDTLVSASSTNATLLAHASHQAAGSKTILLLNSDPTNAATVQVTVTGAALGTTATQYSYGLATTQTGATLPSTTFTIPGNTFAVSVPPYTATELVIP